MRASDGTLSSTAFGPTCQPGAQTAHCGKLVPPDELATNVRRAGAFTVPDAKRAPQPANPVTDNVAHGACIAFCI